MELIAYSIVVMHHTTWRPSPIFVCDSLISLTLEEGWLILLVAKVSHVAPVILKSE